MELTESSTLADVYVKNLGKRLTGVLSGPVVVSSILQAAVDRLPDDDVKTQIKENFQYYEDMLSLIINDSGVEDVSLKMNFIGLSRGPSSVGEILRKQQQRNADTSPASLIHYLRYADDALPQEMCRSLFKLTPPSGHDFSTIADLLGTRVAFSRNWESEYPESTACINAFVIVSRYSQSTNVMSRDWCSSLTLSAHHREAPLLHVAFISYWLNKADTWGLKVPNYRPLMTYTAHSLNIATRVSDISRGEPMDAICALLVLSWLQSFPESREKQEYGRLLLSLQGACTPIEIQSFIGETLDVSISIEGAPDTPSRGNIKWFAGNREVVAAGQKCLENRARGGWPRSMDDYSVNDDDAKENDDENWENILNMSQLPRGEDSADAEEDVVELVSSEQLDDEEDELGIMLDTKGDSSILDQLGDTGANSDLEEDAQVEEEAPKKSAGRGTKRGAKSSAAKKETTVAIEEVETAKRPQRKSRRMKS